MLMDFFSGLGNFGSGLFNAGKKTISAAPGAVSKTTGTVLDVADQFSQSAQNLIQNSAGLIPVLQASGIIKNETVEQKEQEYKNILAAEQQHNQTLKTIALGGAGLAAVALTVAAGLMIAKRSK